MTRSQPARIALPLTAALLAACASTPEDLRGTFRDLGPASVTEDDVGATVRWGGTLLEVRPEQNRTCFEVLSRPLSETGRPDPEGTAGRRFIACRDGFSDPAAFPAERLVTAVGELTGFRTRAIGEYDYRFPVVRARAVHLWPKPRERDAYAPPPWWYDPYYAYPYYRRYPYW